MLRLRKSEAIDQMRVYQDCTRIYHEPRAHPWTVGTENECFRYVDFKSHPELVPEVLEDFRPFSERQAVQTFYSYIMWINGPDSQLETNDCGFRGPKLHSDANSDKRLACNGRVFVFYRNLQYNVIKKADNWLNSAFEHVLTGYDEEFPESLGVVGLTDQRAYYTELPYGQAEDTLGSQLMFSFWAYGDTEDEVFSNLNRLFENVWIASRAVSDHIRQNEDKFEREVMLDVSKRMVV